MTNTSTNIDFDDIDDKYVKSIIGNGIYDVNWLQHPDYSDDQHRSIVQTILNLDIDPFSVKWAEQYVVQYEKRMVPQFAVKLIKQVNELFTTSKLHNVTSIHAYIEASKKVMDYSNLYACQHELIKKVEFADNKAKSITCVYYCNESDGLKNGLDVTYFKNGKIHAITMYHNNKKHGMDITYYESGNLQSIKYYKNDKLFGISKHYWSTGGIQQVFMYYLKNLISIEYNMNDQMKSKLQYSDEIYWIHNGNQISWHNNGQLKGTNSFINGKKEGVERWYYENGNPKSICSYKNSFKVGIEIMYHEDGSINSVKKYDETGCVQSLLA